MALPTLTFDTLVRRFSAAAQGSSGRILDVSTGSIMRALAEANAALGLWMQWLILQVLSRTRLATSVGPDADSFGADFGFVRLPGVAAVGDVLFSRNAPALRTEVPVGATVRTADGTEFAVIADPARAGWTGTGYALPVGIASVRVPVRATVFGVRGNVQAGTISLVASAIPVDAVSNDVPMTSGRDAESDVAFRDRFVLFIASLSRGTRAAVGYAIASLQQGLTYTVLEGAATGQALGPGQFVVTVDDGTGAPSAATLAAVYAAVDAVRPFGTTFQVRGPTVSPITVSANISALPGYREVDLQVAVANAIIDYINGLPLGAGLSYARIVQVAFDAALGVSDVQSVLVNSGTANIPGNPGQLLRASLGTVSVS